MSSNPSIATYCEDFVRHLVDNRYVGPSVPNTVWITRNNLLNIYNLVS